MCTLVELGPIVLVKENDIFHIKYRVPAYLYFAPKGLVKLTVEVDTLSSLDGGDLLVDLPPLPFDKPFLSQIRFTSI